MKNIFVGNLSFGATEDAVRSLFEAYGPVERVSVVTDRDTGQARGFGFVEMSANADADRAISELNGRELDGRALNVNEARPKADRGSGGGGGGHGVTIAGSTGCRLGYCRLVTPGSGPGEERNDQKMTLTVKLTAKELELLCGLASHQLFRREFIDAQAARLRIQSRGVEPREEVN